MSRQSLLVLTIWFGAALLTVLRPIDDVDLLFQIRLGQLAIENQSLLKTDPLSYQLAGQSIANPGWLAQLFFALLYEAGSWPLLRLVHALIFGGAFALAAAAGLRAAGAAQAAFSPAWIFAACGLGFFTAASNNSARPQSIALLCLAWLLNRLRARTFSRTDFLFTILVALVWTNVHASLSLAALIVFVEALGKRPSNQAGHSDRMRLLLLAVLLFGLQLATPDGFRIFESSRNNLLASRYWLGISEWMPPWHPTVFSAMEAFWAALAVTLLLLIRNGRTLDFTDTLLMIIVTAASLHSARFALIWALLMVPVWVKLLKGVLRAGAPQVKPGSRIGRPAAFFCCAIMLLPLLAGAWFTPQLSADMPLNGIQRLKELVPAGRIYNYREWSGPLALEGSRAWRLAIDGRLYLYDRESWRRYQQEALGNVPLGEIIERHDPAAFFLHPGYQAGLIERLARSGAWQLLYRDSNCVVFADPRRIIPSAKSLVAKKSLPTRTV